MKVTVNVDKIDNFNFGMNNFPEALVRERDKGQDRGFAINQAAIHNSAHHVPVRVSGR